MKKAVVTVTIGKRYEDLAKISHPLMRDYAKNIGADFIVWTDFIGHSHPAFKKLDIYKLLDEYDRVIFLDTDLIIRDDCPDLFDVVPEDSFGAFNEFPFTDRVEAMLSYRHWIDWVNNKKYFNTGVFVCSKEHKEIFAPTQEMNNFYEQTGLNWELYTQKIKTFDLSHKFNRMTCLDWTGESRFDSYIMHYAGCPLEQDALIDRMQKDLAIWELRPKLYRRKIHFDVNGGLGDQVCAEPVIRYLKQTSYKNDDVIVTSHYPELFSHIDVKSCQKGQAQAEPDTNYFSVSLPPESKTYHVNNHILTHPVEAASLAAFKGQLPPQEKTIKLEAKPTHAWLMSIAKNCVLVHAGRSWQTKTFPKEFWRLIIDGLLEQGLSVALIGKEVSAEFGYVDLGKFESNKVHDLRDKLSLSELISVIKHAKLGLVSNDSSPIHIAGAFDNPIHLITIAKADYRILPFRHGYQYHRARAYGILLPFRFDANCPHEVRVDKASDQEIFRHLPHPIDVVDGVVEMLECLKLLGSDHVA